MSSEIKVDIAQLDPLFDKWLLDNEAMSGVLNPKVTKENNKCFVLKC